MNLEQLKQMTKQLIVTHPTLKEELVDLFQLAVDEIDEGGSEMHECHLAYQDMMELVDEHKA
jgi:hypothetical protein